jgi:hypothetical protein
MAGGNGNEQLITRVVRYRLPFNIHSGKRRTGVLSHEREMLAWKTASKAARAAKAEVLEHYSLAFDALS